MREQLRSAQSRMAELERAGAIAEEDAKGSKAKLQTLTAQHAQARRPYSAAIVGVLCELSSIPV